ncbi:urea carboxylase [Parathalassolituus penaei]|uniref:Biotin carboxylase n=1 Tax=Parathalassolituus penaei TaxID=2997323 RepID=A0A9X3ISU5_9GAMM|nr:urea carboxylase [Parathalassolituus penaei]MCY0966787.1 urea carboxylase [Parathalassolituus penaei]
MIGKVLIANRGAIATRIIRTLNQMGIASVAIYADCDADSLHVRLADEAVCLNPDTPEQNQAAYTYLNVERILQIARETGAHAIHPGYGFLSENADFVARCEAEGLQFIGPTPEQITTFGLKHQARELALNSQVPLLPGSDLLTDLAAAKAEAARIGYPVMLKSTAGGGGIGMSLCHNDTELDNAFASVKRLGANNFANDGVFLEKFIARARHIEVQVFGDGQGKALAIGERDCSSQRRNQKVVEECPAPNLSDDIRQQLYATAERLLASVAYRNAGTVEFILDADTGAFYFLEVNTRLQVEHGVTEEVYGVDLVQWMVSLAAGNTSDLDSIRQQLKPSGHAIQVRIYAEDPYLNFQPAAGLLSQVAFYQPAEQERVRVDTWVETGIEIPPYFDPMIAKLIVHAQNRDDALALMQKTLDQSQLYGCETNLDYLRVLTRDQRLLDGEITTRYLNDFAYLPARIDVISGGTQTTIQDVPGRSGYWDVGVPPSGPFDSHSFRLANRLLGNPENAAGLEITIQGPTLQFSRTTQVVIGGADMDASLQTAGQGERIPVRNWQVITIEAGQILSLGRVAKTAGARAYLAVAGGIQCPDYLGSKSTFTLGQFGGHNGRGIRAGDVLHLDGSALLPQPTLTELPTELQPAICSLDTPDAGDAWLLHVIYGPHGAPDFFTHPDIDTFFATAWEVHYNSSRTGVRLIGPKPEWARADGGEAGLHPSNLHDNAYAFGSVDFTGDMPVILGPDGPSLGGFVCPATVITADLWKLGQLRAGDKVRFVPVSLETAVALEAANQQSIESLQAVAVNIEAIEPLTPILASLSAAEMGDDVVYRAAGDHFLLVEYGAMELDLRLRFRAHALMQWLQQHPLAGIRELTPGIRSLQVHYNSQQLPVQQLIAYLQQAERTLSNQLDELSVPSRIVHIPLSWDDEACRLAIQKYDQSVRKNAPWAPSNLEFIRRINGLDSIDAVKKIVFDASYLVMGLGDVYLGAPVATPVDPRHRLVTTKYNPARTWTAENSVGIGGSYLCVYGMEGPGGYQFVGRTLQMWNRYRRTHEFSQPYLLRFFDQIRFYEVSQNELMQIRRDFPQGRYPLTIEQGHFSLGEYQQFLSDEAASIGAFTEQRNQAFAAELERWHRDGQFNYSVEEVEADSTDICWPEDAILVDSPVSGSVWQISTEVGASVKAGQVLMILESMKMEITVHAPCDGVVDQIVLKEGGRVNPGQALILMSSVE